MRLSPIIFFVLLELSAYSQSFQGRVLQENSGLPVPFATVIVNSSQQGAVCDENGLFRLHAEIGDTLHIQSLGFKSKQITLDSAAFQNFFLEEETVMLSAVEIKAGINPADTIMANVFEASFINDAFQRGNWTYNEYVKMVISYTEGDSLDSFSKLLENQHLFISESVSKVNYIAENRQSKEVISSKSSGIKGPIISTMTASIDDLNFYTSDYELFENTFYSPVRKNADRTYFFELLNKLDEPTFLIHFEPKSTSFFGYKGTMEIDAATYALIQVDAETYSQNLKVNLSLKHQFNYRSNRWYPGNQYTKYTFEEYLAEDDHKAYVGILHGFTPVDTIAKKKPGPGISVKMAANHENLSELRTDSLDIREQTTYYKLDSLSEESKGVQWVNKLLADTGHIPLVQFAYGDLLRFNEHENIRLGAGLHVNIAPYLRWHLYGGYGFRDKTFKYSSAFRLRMKNGMQLQAGYRRDIREQGRIPTVYELGALSTFRDLIAARMIDTEQFYASFDIPISAGLSINTGLFHENMVSLHEQNAALTWSRVSVGIQNIRNARIIRLLSRDINVGNIYPDLSVKWDGGPLTMHNEQAFIWRIEGLWNRTIPSFGLSNLRIQLKAGYASANTPDIIQFQTFGANWGNFSFLTPGFLQTMPLYGIQSNRYGESFLTWSMGRAIYDWKYSRPQLALIQGGGWYGIEPFTESIRDISSGPYFAESGFTLKNIIRLEYVDLMYYGFGAGVFHGYDPFSYSTTQRTRFVFMMTLEL